MHTARVPAPHNHSHHNQYRTPYAAVHTLVLLMMGIMMPETCCDKSLIINIRLVASCWSLSLHLIFLIMCRSVLHRMREISDKCCRGNQNTHFAFNNFFPENRAVYEIMWQSIVELDRPQRTLWRQRVACWIPKATNNTAAMVTRTHLNIELYVHWLFVECYN